MIKILPANSLFSMDIGWLSLRDHFISTVGPNSGKGHPLGNLLVMADATLAPQSSFQPHPHKDIEILTWVAEGVMNHQDNLGESAQIPAGTVQLMSARDGIFHAEGNSQNTPVRLVQIWIAPNQKGGKPLYGTASPVTKGFNLLAGPQNAPLPLRQDVELYVAVLDNELAELSIPNKTMAYGVSIGNLNWNQTPVQDGDGLIVDSGNLKIQGKGQAILIIQR